MKRRSSVRSASTAIIELAWRSIFFLLLLYFLLQGVKLAYSYGHGLLYEPAMETAPGRDIELVILPGEDRKQLAEKLEEAGLIGNSSAFLVQSRLYEAEYVAGSYTLNTSMSMPELIACLTEEGKKLSELKDKKLLNSSVPAAAVPEEPSMEPEVIGGGNEDVQED